MSDFVLNIMRMGDDELLEFLVGEVENRASYIALTPHMTETDWKVVDMHTDKIETIKAEILRRM